MLTVAPPAQTPADLDRFPTLPTCHAQIGALIRLRYALHQSPASPDRTAALRFNVRQLAAWEALLELRGGLADEGVDLDTEGQRRAVARLRAAIGEEGWRLRRMP
jgi:hypothetical protein